MDGSEVSRNVGKRRFLRAQSRSDPRTRGYVGPYCMEQGPHGGVCQNLSIYSLTACLVTTFAPEGHDASALPGGNPEEQLAWHTK